MASNAENVSIWCRYHVYVGARVVDTQLQEMYITFRGEMTWHRSGHKPLPEPIMTHGELDPRANAIKIESWLKVRAMSVVKLHFKIWSSPPLMAWVLQMYSTTILNDERTKHTAKRAHMGYECLSFNNIPQNIFVLVASYNNFQASHDW